MHWIQWLNHEHICAGCTLRDTHLPANGDMALHTGAPLQEILYNRQLLADEIGIQPSQFTFAMQTHSDHIYRVEKQDRGRGAFSLMDAIPDHDALYTRKKGIALGVFHADCVPILLYDPIHALIAAIHSGWKGTVQEILTKTLLAIKEKEAIDPSYLHAYIGPSIAYSSLEVGADVLSQLQRMSFDTSAFITPLPNGKAYMDNKGLNREMLLRAGVAKERITVDKNDTFVKNDAFFSYRRHAACGRHLSFIVMR